MPIPVACVCGARFAAPDNLAGRTVKCPKCQSPLNIPAGAPAAPAMAAPFPGPGMPSQQMPSQQMQNYGMPTQPASAYAPGPTQPGYVPQTNPHASLFDDAGLKQAAAGTIPCPGCTAPLNPGTVVCVQCGYNLKLGRKMGTINMDRPDGGGHGGHGDAAATLLEKAKVAIEEDREYEASKGKEGMPWWSYLLILMGLLGFTVLMMTLPPDVAMKSAGIFILIGCGAGSFYYQVRNWMTAFEESTMHGVLCLLIPFYYLYYCFTRWDKCGGNFMASFTIGIAGNLGWAMIFLADMAKADGGPG